MLRLLLPTCDDAVRVMAYREEFLEHGDSLDGTAGLAGAERYEDWFAAWRDNGSEETVRPGLVPATTYLAVDEAGELVGMIDLRHRLNDYLLQFGGHIGYSVRKSRRRRGFATEMLALVLEEARKLGLDRVLVTCDKENTASARTIEKNGGVLENEVAEGGRMTRRYWVTL